MDILQVLQSLKHHSYNHSWGTISPKTEEKAQYWYQVVKAFDFMQEVPAPEKGKVIGILGYACDEGVRRNKGRVGAADGPEAIRERLAHLAHHIEVGKSILDFGDILCPDKDMETAQESLKRTVQAFINTGVFPLLIGGGHDIAYGHYAGLHAAMPDADIGVINFDAHLDLRPPHPQGNSGTPFNQIYELLKSKGKPFHYLPIGIQQYSNTKTLFAKANEISAPIIYLQEISSSNSGSVEEKINSFIALNDYIYITIDLDGISSAYAPGVSAPSPLGITPDWLYYILGFIFQSGKVISCDLAEMNPVYDIDKRTAKLAAEFITRLVDLF